MASSDIISNKLDTLIFETWSMWSWWWDGLTEYTLIRVLATLLVATLIISWYASLIKKSTKYTPPPPLPPGPRGLPLIGNLPFIEPDFHRYFAKLSSIYGPIIKLQLGRKTCIVISSPSLAKEVLKDQDATFANRDPPAAALAITYGGLDIAWGANGPEWRKLRKVCVREMMCNTSLDACYSLRKQEVQEMLKEVYGKVGSPINIGEQMFVTIFNVIINMLWGASLHGNDRSSVGVQFREVIGEIVGLLGEPNISDLFPVLARFDLQGIESRMKKLLVWFDRVFESLISTRMKLGLSCAENKKDFLQVLLELKQQGDDKSSLTMEQIKAMFMDIIVGGTDTSATTVEWTMAELLGNPETMRKACKELEDVVGNGNLVQEIHLPKLHYLDAIIKETFRLHPPLPLLVPHCPSRTCIVSGYTIPEGSRIFFNVWAMQRDSEAWENPLEFQPERFLEDDTKGDYQGNNFNFLPFGSGRRICAGIPLAEKMVLYVLATLLHSFEWKLPEGTDLDLSEKFGLVLKKTKPLIAIPTAKNIYFRIS